MILDTQKYFIPEFALFLAFFLKLLFLFRSRLNLLMVLIKSVTRISIHHTEQLQQFIKLQNRNASFTTYICIYQPPQNPKRKRTFIQYLLKCFEKDRIILKYKIYLLAQTFANICIKIQMK